MEKDLTRKKPLIQLSGQEPPKLLAVGIQTSEVSDDQMDASIVELAELVKTAGGRIVGNLVQKRNKLERNSYLGKGKMTEAAEMAARLEAVQIIADNELSGLQIRRMEEGINVPVIDRTRVILEIFAQHATTREGKLQVELANLHYALVRLTGAYEGLSRQRGGIGAKGPGEMKIETDRRVLKFRIQKLDEELKKMVQNREVQRQKRSERYAPLFSLVGYTNAGKSTLLNALSGSEIATFDGLFTTLDPTARKVLLPGGRSAIVSDTVGFIRKLPHGLVKAFRATLENVLQSQVIVLVSDVSSLDARDRITAVEEVLRQIGVLEHEKVMVFNKIDLVPDCEFEALKASYPDSIFISARTGANLPALIERMDSIISRDFTKVELALPVGSPLVHEILAMSQPSNQTWEGDLVKMKVELPKKFLPQVEPFLVSAQ